MQRVWSTYLDSSGVQHYRQRSGNAPDPESPQSSRRNSVAGSAYSAAGSTRHMLAEYNQDRSGGAAYLEVPRYNGPVTPMSSGSASGVSLMVNYIPNKFGGSGTAIGRKGRPEGLPVPKYGGGRYAFRSNEERIGGRTLRWTAFKWWLFIANLLLSLYSIGGMITIILVWFNVWDKSEIIRIGNTTELIVATIAAVCGLITSLVGWAGILLNNRTFLSIYCLLTWLTFAFLVTPGYITFRKRSYNLEGKVNAQWSRALDPYERMRIQSQLNCCGYFSPYVEATVSQTCYARSILVGCKEPYLNYQRHILTVFFTMSFAVVPAHLFVMITALMASNHVTYRFGKGMMPEAYRLNLDSMAVIMDQYAAQLADQYGPDVANKVLEKSRSDLSLDRAYKGGAPPGKAGR